MLFIVGVCSLCGGVALMGGVCLILERLVSFMFFVESCIAAFCVMSFCNIDVPRCSTVFEIMRCFPESWIDGFVSSRSAAGLITG